MKKYMTIALLFIAVAVNAKTITPGQVAPEIKLKNIDNKVVSFSDYPNAKGFIIVFTCNTCPYAVAYEDRIIELNKKYSALGYPVIAVNTNDPSVSAGDSFTKMQNRAKDKKFSFPYLYDQGQTFTNLYGATATPHVFIASKSDKGLIVEYTGAIDNDTENINPQKIKFAEDALSAIMSNKKPAVTTTKAIGCTIKRAS